MNIDEIEAGWSEYIYAWVRPANNQTWAQMHGSSFGQINERDWRPALISSFSDKDDRERYNTGADPRRVTLIGNASSHNIDQFEFGALISLANSK
jgi:hypothetical protein